MRFVWLFLVVLILGSCRSGEIACPEVKAVRLNKRPANYMRSHSRSYSASAQQKKDIHSKYEIPLNSRPVKRAESIEEWDCPKPGTKATLPKAVKENIKKNRKKFDSYYKNKHHPDSLHAKENSRFPR